jgi:hypothetical protein
MGPPPALPGTGPSFIRVGLRGAVAVALLAAALVAEFPGCRLGLLLVVAAGRPLRAIAAEVPRIGAASAAVSLHLRS